MRLLFDTVVNYTYIYPGLCEGNVNQCMKDCERKSPRPLLELIFFFFFLGIKQYKRTSIRPLNVTPSNLLNG